MKKFEYNQLNNRDYFGLITVLDYEFNSNYYLKNLSFPLVDKSKKLLIDLALKVGVTEYRFAEVALDKNGSLIWESLKNTKVDKKLERKANSYLKKNSLSLQNSFITNRQRQLILNNV